ncbi:MAG: hypothetical protein KAH21_08400, partial [Spirochaetaceae bacterium]|nr:hypothetical protein [Spirochaetaceae bacterium]
IFRRAVSLGLPMAEATLRRADITSEALLSRCYTDKPTSRELSLRFTDILITLTVILPPLILGFILRVQFFNSCHLFTIFPAYS